MNPRPQYEKLGSSSGRLAGTGSVWLAPDHILAVLNHRFTEDYVRFYLRDIQAITICKRARFDVPIIILAAWVAAFFVAIIGETSQRSTVEIAGWFVLAALVLGWLGVSLFFSCTFHIQTAVSWREVASLNRMWKARKVLTRLEQVIEAEQGKLSEDWDEGVQPELQMGPVSMVAEALNSNTVPRHLWIAPVALGFLVIDGLVSWANRTWQLSVVNMAGPIVTLAAVSLALAACILVRSDSRFRGLWKLFLTAFILVGLANYGTFLAATLSNAMKVNFLGVQTFSYWLNEAAEFGLGALGFILLLRIPRGVPSSR